MGEPRIEYMPLPDALRRFAKRNPKQHRLDVIAESIRERGFNAPPVLNEATGKWVAGHGRLLALDKLHSADPNNPPARIKMDDRGQWLVPVMRGVSFASEAQAEEYLIADNRLVELGGWELPQLAKVLEDIRKRDRLVGVGYSSAEVDAIVAQVRAGNGKSGPSMADRFVVPPFTVLDARQGYWQDRKRQWIALGIQSELGRGGGANAQSEQALRLAGGFEKHPSHRQTLAGGGAG